MEHRSENGAGMDSVAEEIGSLADNARDMILKIRRKFNDRMNTAYEASKQTKEQVDAYAQQNPWRFAAGALAAGFVLGWLFRRKD